MRKLLVFDVIFGARTKKLAGINDKNNFITTDVVISDSDNSITFTTIDLPSFFKVDGYFRIFGGPNNKDLFRIRDIDGNKILTYENVANDSTARTLDARLWVVHDNEIISRENPTGGTMYNLDNVTDTGVECDSSQVAQINASHYHTDQEKNVVKNQICDASVYVGSFVYIEAGIANNGLANDIATSRVIGVVESKPTTTTCNIRIGGLTGSIFSGLDDNNNYFLSSTVAGEASLTVTTGSGNVLVKLGKPTTDKILLLGIDLRVIRV